MFNYEILFPLLGNIIGNLLGLSLIQTSQEVKRNKALDSLNPYIFPVVTNYCISWVIYAVITRDVWVFFSLVVTLFTSLELNLTIYQYINSEYEKKLFSLIFLIFPAVFYGYIYWYVFLCQNINDARFSIGILCSILQVLYYASPLASIKEVIINRSSESMYFPMVATNVVNSILWLAYSFLIKDPFQFVPNSISVFISIIQLILFLVYYKQKIQTPADYTPLSIC